MTKDYYKQALFAARVQREGLVKKMNALDKERESVVLDLEQLEGIIQGLRDLVGEPDVKTQREILKLDGLSFADACREVLKASDRYMSPIRVRNGLQIAKYDLSGQSNPLASIHAVLKRLEESGEVESLKIEGKTGYRWKRREADSTAARPKKQAKHTIKRLAKATKRAKEGVDNLSFGDLVSTGKK